MVIKLKYETKAQWKLQIKSDITWKCILTDKDAQIQYNSCCPSFRNMPKFILLFEKKFFSTYYVLGAFLDPRNTKKQIGKSYGP